MPIDPSWQSRCQGTFPGSYLFSSSISQVQGGTQSVCTVKAEMQVVLLFPVTWPCSPVLRLTAPVSPPATFSQTLMGLLWLTSAEREAQTTGAWQGKEAGCRVAQGIVAFIRSQNGC